MCGIAGFLDADPDRDAWRIEALTDRLRQRGPDGPSSAVRGGVALVQTRLAVVDLSERVSYPMGNESGDVWLVFNGEVYGHRELRRELEGFGHRFATDCDAEVIVHGWEQWGVELFGRLDAMFALALLDERTGELILARDRCGIKPLVRTTGARLAFASDALALASAGLSDAELDSEALSEFLAFHYVPPPLTGLQDVIQVEPGTVVIRSADGFLRTTKWAAPVFGAPAPEEPVGIDALDEALRRSVGLQLHADVPVGVLLSGGIDSALVLSMAAEHGAAPTAYTLSFEGHGDYDELELAKIAARAAGAEHRIDRFDLGFADALSQVAHAYDSPFADSSAIATLQLSRFVRQEVTVALSGTGGDELFAGYSRHRAHRIGQLLRLVPEPVAAAIARGDQRRGGEHHSQTTRLRSYAVRLAASRQDDPVRQYLRLVGSTTSPAGVAAVPELRADGALERVERRFAATLARGGSTTRHLLGFDLATYLPGDLLVKEDRAMMAVGLEGRVPVLGNDMLHVASRMPDSEKHSLRRGKLALRELAERRLPKEHTTARKRGFAVPLARMLETNWAAAAREVFGDADSALVDRHAALELLDRRPVPAADIWALATLLSWERAVVDARSAAAARVIRAG